MPSIRGYLRVISAVTCGLLTGLWLLLFIASDACLDRGGRVWSHGLRCEFEGDRYVAWTALVGPVMWAIGVLVAVITAAAVHRALAKWW